MFQSLAEQMQAAFIGVSGTLCRGRSAYIWSEDPARDLAHVEGALGSQAEQVTLADGRIILFGLSQGAAIAAELAARRPDRYAGAILISPRQLIRTASPDFEELVASREAPKNARQGIIAVCSADDEPEVLEATKAYAQAFEKLGARVHLATDLQKKSQTLIPDCLPLFPEWRRFIVNPDAPAADRQESNPSAERAAP